MNECLLLGFAASNYTKQTLAEVETGGLLYRRNDNDMFNGRLGNTPGATAYIAGTTTQAEMRGQVYLKTPDMPTDSLFTDEWYLNDINVLPVWNGNGGQGYTGKGINIAQFEPGMPFSTGAEVFDYRHPDLQANVDQSWIANPNPNPSPSPSPNPNPSPNLGWAGAIFSRYLLLLQER